ncbi:MAG: hypothetical protein ABJE10_14100, partial [bacterium]
MFEMRIRSSFLLFLFLLIASASCSTSADTAPETTSDAASAQVITSDLAHFWAAYDDGGKSGSASAFQRLYLDAASTGLGEFIGKKNLTAASLAQMVVSRQSYFASIRATNLALANDGVTVGRIRANFAVIKDLYPAAVFPPVTLLIGRFSTGGTTSASGMLIGSEFYSINASTPLNELTPFERDNVKSIDSLPIIVAHEHAHVLQSRAGGLLNHSNKTLLEQSLIEGGADFIGERSSGGNINGKLWPVALSNESALWQEFKGVMHGTDISRWLYNQGSSTATASHPG